MGWINTAQHKRDHNGQRGICGACGHPFTAADPQVLTDDGYRIHRSETTNPCSGYYRRTQPKG